MPVSFQSRQSGGATADVVRSIRRVKCDQNRPQCGRCTSTGRACEGYELGVSPRDSNVSRRPLLPSYEPWSLSPLQRSVGFAFDNFTSDERDAFDFFLRKTAPPLWSISPAKGWVQLALQFSHKEPAVFYAIVAVGTIANENDHIQHYTLVSPAYATKREPALRQYCKAMASLQKYINGAIVHQANMEPVLLCCVLFMCFELLQGKDLLALSHLRLGRRAIQNSGGLGDHEESTYTTALKAASQEVTKELLYTFERLESESIDLGPGNLAVPEDDKESFKRAPPRLPAYFSSVEHAKAVLDDLVASTSRFRMELLRLAEDRIATTGYNSPEQALRYCVLHCMSRTVDTGPDHQINCRQSELIHSHRVWLAMFARLEGTQESLPTRSLILMQIQHFVSTFNLATSRETLESSTDRFEDEYVRILDLIDDYLRGTQLSARSPSPQPEPHMGWTEPQRSFSIGLAVLPALYLICLKCRFLALRNRALALLRNADRREGRQWSGELATYGESLINLEMERAETLHGGKCESIGLNTDEIPEAARFLDVVIDGRGFRDIRIVCGRYQHERDGELELVEYSGSGSPPLRLQPLRQIVFPLRRKLELGINTPYTGFGEWDVVTDLEAAAQLGRLSQQ